MQRRETARLCSPCLPFSSRMPHFIPPTLPPYPIIRNSASSHFDKYNYQLLSSPFSITPSLFARLSCCFSPARRNSSCPSSPCMTLFRPQSLSICLSVVVPTSSTRTRKRHQEDHKHCPRFSSFAMFLLQIVVRLPPMVSLATNQV